MINDEFLVLKYIKIYILSLDEYVDNLPRKEYVLKDNIIKKSYELLELVYLCNNNNDKKNLQNKMLTDINLLDFYIEVSFKKNILAKKSLRKLLEI